MVTEKEGKEMKVLLFDIETSPNIGAFFQLYREGNIVWTDKDWYILSFSYKWLGKPAKVKGLPDYKTFKKDRENDKELVKDLWKLFDEADVLVAHNGNAFDIKKVRTRFLIHGMEPPSPCKSVDTKLVAKSQFNFDSNKLDDLARQLGLEGKEHTGGLATWRGCMAGDKKCWDRMMSYNKQDVVLLEKVYLKLRGWMPNHPNFNVINGTSHNCPNCGSVNTERRGFSVTRVSKRQRYQCRDCGSWHQGETVKPIEKVVVR